MAKTPWGQIFKTFTETTPVKTQDIIAKGAKTEKGRELETAIEQKVAEPKILSKVEPTDTGEKILVKSDQQPVETKGPIEIEDPYKELSDVELVEQVTKETDVPVGRPSEVDITQSNINFDKIDTEDELKKILVNIGNMGDNFFEARGQKTLAQIAKDAEKTPLDDILGFKVGDAFTPEMVAGAKRALILSADQIKLDAKKILSGNASEADYVTFRRRVSVHVGIQQSAAGLTAESSRALSANKIIAAKPKEGEVNLIYKNQLDELYNQLGKDNTKRLAAIIDKTDNLLDFNKATRKLHNKYKGNFFLEFWINSILSNPTTHAVNMMSNAVTALWAVPERLIASSIGGAKRLVGKEGYYEPGEVVAQTFGILQGIRDGMKMGWDTIRTGEAVDFNTKIETQNYRSITASNLGVNPTSTFGKGIDLMGNMIRMPGRFLAGEDDFFKAIGYRMELNANAFRKAKAEGLEGEELGKRIIDLINNPTDDLHLDATQFSRVQTFTNELGETGSGLQKLTNVHWAFKLVAPFIRTPTNIAKYALTRSPLQIMNRNFYRDIAAGGARQETALAKAALGNTVFFSAMNYALEGKITGAGPVSKKEREALKLQGWQEYSIKIGDTWYSYNRFDPIGMLFAMSSDVAEVYRYSEDTNDYMELFSAGVLSVIKNISSKTYLEGVANATKAIDDPDGWASAYSKRQLGSMIPFSSLSGQITRTIDPVVREKSDLTYWNELMNEFKSRTPGLSMDLPPRRNFFGEPITREMVEGIAGIPINMISPFYTKTAKYEPVANALYENKVSVTMPPKTLTENGISIDLDPQEYDRLVVFTTKDLKIPMYNYTTGAMQEMNMYQALRNVMMSPGFKKSMSGDKTQRQYLLQQQIDMYKDTARLQFLLGDKKLSKIYNIKLIKQEAEQRKNILNTELNALQ